MFDSPMSPAPEDQGLPDFWEKFSKLLNKEERGFWSQLGQEPETPSTPERETYEDFILKRGLEWSNVLKEETATLKTRAESLNRVHETQRELMLIGGPRRYERLVARTEDWETVGIAELELVKARLKQLLKQ
jgi:hypothetical protein